MHMCEQWRFHCTSQRGWQMLLSEHVYCVTIKYKMTEWVEQWICIKFCIKLEYSSMKIIGMIQKPHLRATGDRQLGHDNMPAYASCLVQRFFVKHEITEVTQPHYSPDLVPCDFWLFLKLKSPLRGKRFQTINEIQENTIGQLMAIGRTGWCPKMPTLKGPETSLSCVQCFLYLVSSSINASVVLHGQILSAQTSVHHFPFFYFSSFHLYAFKLHFL